MDRKEMFIVRTNRRRANGRLLFVERVGVIVIQFVLPGARGEGLRHLFTVVER
jgi:hypothetical protein